MILKFKESGVGMRRIPINQCPNSDCLLLFLVIFQCTSNEGALKFKFLLSVSYADCLMRSIQHDIRIQGYKAVGYGHSGLLLIRLRIFFAPRHQMRYFKKCSERSILYR